MTMSVAGLPGFPAVTLGTMAIAPGDTVSAIHSAIALGYRSFDTAPIYGNEPEVGEAIRSAPVDRADLFVTTKLWNSCHGYDEALGAFDRTMARMPAYAHLETIWSNFLLGCTNCNSTKGNQDVVLADLLLPDRDNTFLAYDYAADGSLTVAAGLAPPLRAQAAELLRLTGLDRTVATILDDNDRQIVVDRVSKRINVFAKAREVLAKLEKRPHDIDFIETIVMLAAAEGCFSIWMKVFQGYPEVCQRLIDAHPGTRNSGCFDAVTQAPISPHPNNDAIVPGGRI